MQLPAAPPDFAKASSGKPYFAVCLLDEAFKFNLTAKSVRRSLYGEGGQLYYVYILKSVKFDETYVGLTDDLRSRVKDHNSGKSSHTAKFKPWNLTSYFAFSTKDSAAKFEKYLKSGSSRAFAKKHFF